MHEAIVGKPIGKRLETLRQSTGMNQYEVAAKLGVDQSTISRWESGSSSPSGLYLSTLERLFKRYKVAP